MTRSSPARRSPLLTSPERSYLSSFLSDDRNNEFSHLEALAAAQKQHERVRESAIRVYRLHELQEEQKRIAEQERQEQERLKREADIAAEERRLQELKAKTVPKPPPPPPEPQPQPETKPDPKPEPKAEPEKKPEPKPEPVKPQETKAQPSPAVLPPSQPNGIFSPKQDSQPSTSALPAKPAEPAASPFAKPNGVPAATSTAPTVTATPKTEASQSPRRVLAERYYQIHKELKTLRKNLTDESKRPGSPLKGKLGQARRDIRMAIGQLVGVKGGNSQPSQKITAVLKATLDGTVPSPLVPVSTFVTDQREPVEGATQNGDSLPALFIYLMNIFAKGIVNQFINEGGANPKAAEPIGVFTAHIFSDPNFQWRGRSLIDILMAKYCVACPILWGFRGNDRTEKGRLALGWRKDEGSWIPEQSHNDRMTGLGAGFASISLRDFSLAKKANPYPPTNYWTALAGIINTPKGETSNTQYVVVRAMIDGHEQRFLKFYGNAALAALKLALVEFPKKAPETAAAAGSLRTLADVFTEEGLNL